MNHYFYNTPEEYEYAAQFGISPAMLDRRIREQGWSKEKALNTPPQKRADYGDWSAIAAQNGIKYATFHTRLRRGWSPKDAATKPLPSPEEIRLQALNATKHVRVYPEKYIQLAEKNCIPYHTFWYRVKNLKWDYERAATEPVWNRSKIGSIGAQRLREREGDWAAQIFGKR